jgi:hypothetical protein
VHFKTAFRIGEDASWVGCGTVVCVVVDSRCVFIVFFAVVRSSRLSQVVLTCSVREADVPATEIINNIIGSGLDGYLGWLDNKVGRSSPSWIVVSSILYCIFGNPNGFLAILPG